jgi:hypothetical protein
MSPKKHLNYKGKTLLYNGETQQEPFGALDNVIGHRMHVSRLMPAEIRYICIRLLDTMGIRH